MNQMCGYLVANLMVATNLRVAAERDAEAAQQEAAWKALQERARAMGCQLDRCHLDPECDGSCGNGPGIRDRNWDPVGDLASDEPLQDLGMATLLIEQLEANGGVRR